jgi:hypothetical protein
MKYEDDETDYDQLVFENETPKVGLRKDEAFQGTPLITNIRSEAENYEEGDVAYIPTSYEDYKKAKEQADFAYIDTPDYVGPNDENLLERKSSGMPSDISSEDARNLQDRLRFRNQVIQSQFKGEDPTKRDVIKLAKDAVESYKLSKMYYSGPTKNQKQINKEAVEIDKQVMRVEKNKQLADSRLVDKLLEKFDSDRKNREQLRRQQEKEVTLEARRKAEAVERERISTEKAEFGHINTLNKNINAMTEDNTKPISQNNYDALRNMAHQAGYDIKWNKDKDGVAYGDEKYKISLEKVTPGYQNPEKTLYFDRNGWKHQAEDGKWYTGKPSGNAQTEKTIVKTGKDKSGRKVVQYSDGTIDYAK